MVKGERQPNVPLNRVLVETGGRSHTSLPCDPPESTWGHERVAGEFGMHFRGYKKIPPSFYQSLMALPAPPIPTQPRPLSDMSGWCSVMRQGLQGCYWLEDRLAEQTKLKGVAPR